MITEDKPDTRTSLWLAVGALTLAGLALRIAAAQGGLWTDEAWSMVYAQQARDPIGVFLRINHDNNHHLNSLWLQAVGMHASSVLMRAPAILAGSLMIPAAALLFAKRSAAAATAAAALFAFSPIMVTYGSEARGYAPMMLAALLMILLVAKGVEGRDDNRSIPWLIALTAMFGMLSNLTMLAAVALLTLWAYLEKRSSIGASKAVRSTLSLMAPGLAACAAVILLVLVAAASSAKGLKVGGYTPFSVEGYTAALANLSAWTAGLTFSIRWLAPIVLLGIGLAMLIRPPSFMGARARLYGLFILGVPVVIAIERTGNSQFARYYLCSAIGLLLLGAEWIAQSVKGGRIDRALCATGCALFLVTALWHDAQLIRLERGQPDRAIRLMAAEAPRGAEVDVRTYMLSAPIIVAARQADYPISVAKGCAPAEFMIVARGAHSTPTAMRCGQSMRAVGWSEATVLTGDSWVLYRAQSLQSQRSADSGRAPAAGNRRISGRAGVAQG